VYVKIDNYWYMSWLYTQYLARGVARMWFGYNRVTWKIAEVIQCNVSVAVSSDVVSHPGLRMYKSRH